jgi:hypothetical protein
MKKVFKLARFGVVVGFYGMAGKFLYDVLKKEKYI